MELAVAVRACGSVAGPQIAHQLFATSLSCSDTSLSAVTGGQRLLPAGTQRPSLMAGGARRMLADLTNRPEALAARPAKAPPAKAAAAQQPPTAEAPPPEAPQLEQQLDECDVLLRSFRQLGVDAPAAAAEDDDNQPLEAEDSGTSTATAGSTQLGFSSAKEAGWSSPLAAFAAAKERLVRNTLDADSLLARLGSTRPPAPDAATPRAPAPGSSQPAASTARSSLLARLPLETVSAAQRGNLLPQHQRQHVLLLRERLTATMQLCQVLHTQVCLLGVMGRVWARALYAPAWYASDGACSHGVPTISS